MANPVLEDDVVERLNSLAVWLNARSERNAAEFCVSVVALIEQQRRTIEELTVCLAESLKESVDTRAKTIEECAALIEARAIERHGHDKHADAKAIRSMDGGAK